MPDEVPIVPTTPQVGQSPNQARNQQQQQQLDRQKQAQERQKRLQKKSEQQPFRRAYRKSLGKGSLCVFNYQFYKHDPYPMQLVSSIYSDGKVAGLNLHYLTFRYVKFLIKQYCGSGSFSYQNIKGDRYIVNAFRTYKPNGMRNIKMIDCQFLLSILGRIRSFNPNEIEAIRKEVQEQLGRATNPKASDEVGHERMFPAPYKEYSDRTPPPLRPTQGDKRFNPRGTSPIE